VRIHVVIARRCNVLAQLSTHRLNVGDDLLYLAVGNLLPERRHAIRTAFDDRRVNVFRLVTIDPFLIHEWRPNPATAVEVTTAAVVLRKQTLAFVCVDGMIV